MANWIVAAVVVAGVIGIVLFLVFCRFNSFVE